MKKVAFILFFTINGLISYAQTQVAEAKTSATTGARMTVTYQGTVAYITRETIPFNSNLIAGVSDLANVGFTDGRFVIPSPGNFPYWFVPFDTAPAMQASGGDYCPACSCEGSSGGTCIQNGSKCQGITCSDCAVSLSNCGSSVVCQGSVAIIRATQIVFN